MAATGRVFGLRSNIPISSDDVSLRNSPFRRPTSISYCSDDNGNSAPRRKRLLACAASKDVQYRIKEEGQVENHDYRVFLLDSSGKKISPWHDIPLQLDDGVFNFVVEIPKDTNLRMEVATDEQFTPIKQDERGGRLRCNLSWNYGLLPQTWEDPSSANLEVEGAFGDNDPVDVIEIGDSPANIGDVLKVKPLAALALIDEGKLDWKIIAISLKDVRETLVNDVDDVEKFFPGALTSISSFFRDYKMIYGGVRGNKYGLGNKPLNKDYALKVIRESNEAWSKLSKRSS
ncbi:OLC1v1002799C2 [Oldenlandia corymbosa var. corymbosa]|uniref:inorganic diphosphatase n=1 Tax=Oldenlandia corymbosa var. corymbosa TaxID=529605 RepID=A0AAV1DBE7_OLDCO|nr:OLC1v1002799C2 [Oldenlandia corymbosa var. corymbosa]